MAKRVRYQDGVRIPDPIFTPKDHITAEMAVDIYGTCIRGNTGQCIHSQYDRTVASALGREIRAPKTHKGQNYWSELVETERGDMVWARFSIPLKPDYAKMIDKYDATGKHFRVPRNSPYNGPVRFLGLCQEFKHLTEKERKYRKDAHIARKASGEAEVYTPRAPQYKAAVKVAAERAPFI